MPMMAGMHRRDVLESTWATLFVFVIVIVFVFWLNLGAPGGKPMRPQLNS